MKTYPNKIIIKSTDLPPNGIFVFGSNTQGRHGKGAALTAAKEFGAIYGNAFFKQGRSYAICTKDLTVSTHPSVCKELIIQQISLLYLEALDTPDIDYYIAYGVESNLNGYTPHEMANMFNSFDIPNNIIFNEKFAKLLEK